MKKILPALLFSLFTPVLLADLAPGYKPLAFKAARPGSYQLPVIRPAADGQVLTSQNEEKHLYDFMGDKIVLLSFIYSTCSDVNGCPLATAVFHKISQKLQKQPEIAKKLRLLTLSFNPQYDTPKAMRHYASGFKDSGLDWHFLTTRSETELNPILDQYQQNIQKIFDAQGNFTGTFSHILRVYLIDTHKQIRNIYSVSFLHADTLINDVKTLLLEQKTVTDPTNATDAIYKAGDNKQLYEQADYQTHSIALTHRQGQPADLSANIKHPPLGLPAVPVPEDNPVTTEKILLGRKLFFDRRLSLNNTFSCAMCHIPEQGFTSQEMATAVGIEGRTVRRNSPTIYNTAYATRLFHDGRENSLELQVWGPLLARNEMGNPSMGYIIDKIKSLPEYPALFIKAFGKQPDILNLGQAIASYERTLISADSPFDRWYYGKQKNALPPAAQQGFKLFTGKAGCSQCHTLNKHYALFTDNQFHNTGIGYQQSMQKNEDKKKILLAPGLFIEVDTERLETISAPKPNDLGRYEITQNPQDRWKYKTPSLRNIALTAPYMHDGSLARLEDVIRFYNHGGINNENLDPLIKPLHLNETEIQQLKAFLNALTGSNVKQLVSDAFAAPVGDQ